MKESREDKVAAATKDINDFYAIGNTSVNNFDGRAKDGKNKFEREEEKIKLGPFTLYKARQFASRYTQDEVDDLCRDIGEQLDCGGAIFGKSHLIRLLSVKNKPTRSRLQENAITEGWTFHRLGAEISKRFGRRRAGGKKPRIPEGLTGVYEQLESRCIAWSRWAKKAKVSEMLKGSRDEDRQRIRSLFEKATHRLELLHKSVSAALKKKWRKRKLIVEKKKKSEAATAERPSA